MAAVHGEEDEKRALGAYYTQGNPFVYPAFADWIAQIDPEVELLEPFAGDGDIIRLMQEAGYTRRWARYDIQPGKPETTVQDTIADFPSGFSAVITNPPYLSHGFAKRKGVEIRKEDFRGYSSLYMAAVELGLAECDYVAMIIPESFITSGLFRERLQHVVSLPFQMFSDTDMPTALALWGKQPSDDFQVWRQDENLGAFKDLASVLTSCACGGRIHFNRLDGQIGLKAIDSSAGPSIRFCPPGQIPDRRIKHSARLVSRIYVDDLPAGEVDAAIDRANQLLDTWRQQTQDVLLTAFKGHRSDGLFRRRLDFANARALLAEAICSEEHCGGGQS